MANKLELIWYGKRKTISVEPRILIHDIERSNYIEDSCENMLIHVDNLLALKALEKKYSRNVKCIYIEIILQRLIQFNDCPRALPLAG